MEGKGGAMENRHCRTLNWRDPASPDSEETESDMCHSDSYLIMGKYGEQFYVSESETIKPKTI
jgi:hypothetical protein